MARKFLMGAAITAGSGTASRPPNPIAGSQHWRSDKNFMEIYDGTNWKVDGVVVVSSTADITTPYNGQMVINSADSYRTYVYNGSAWVLYKTQQAEGGEYRGATTGTGQSCATGATKLVFPNTIKAVQGAGITWSAANNWFVTQEDGVWAMSVFAKVPFVSGNSVSVSIAGNSYPSAQGSYTGDDFSAGTTDVANDATRWLVSGSTIAAYMYNNGSAFNLATSARPSEFAVWRVA